MGTTTSDLSSLLSGNSLNRRILVVDDDPAILDLYRSTFIVNDSISSEISKLLNEESVDEGFSFEIVTESQGEDGVEAVRMAKQQGRPFAVVFLDIMMPPGIDGLETASRIREIDTDIHIVISSAHSEYNPSDFRGHVFGHLYFMRKPINPAEIEHMAYNASMSWNRNQQLQQELNNNIAYRNWLNQLFESLPVPVVVVDINSYEVLMSGGPLQTSAPPNHCYRQLHHRDTPCTGEQGGCPIQQVREQGEAVVIEHIHTSADGEPAHYELHCIPIHNEQNEVYQMLEFSIDVTDRVQRLKEKETLVRQQKQLFDTFRSTAHTMKNSISYLGGMTERISAIPERTGAIGELLSDERVELIQEQVSMIHTMLQLALGSAKSSANQQTNLSLQQKIDETLSLFAISTLGKGKEVKLEMQAEPQLCIQMSSIDCQTMLQNLLNNAADAVDHYMNNMLSSGDPEDLERLMALQDRAMIHLAVTEQAGEVTIEVINQGDTIPHQHLDAIFEQGFSQKESGNGVGLYDVRQILQQSGGSIAARNLEEGVSFRVKVPRTDCGSEGSS